MSDPHQPHPPTDGWEARNDASRDQHHVVLSLRVRVVGGTLGMQAYPFSADQPALTCATGKECSESMFVTDTSFARASAQIAGKPGIAQWGF
jgi:hypothetical protein